MYDCFDVQILRNKTSYKERSSIHLIYYKKPRMWTWHRRWLELWKFFRFLVLSHIWTILIFIFYYLFLLYIFFYIIIIFCNNLNKFRLKKEIKHFRKLSNKKIVWIGQESSTQNSESDTPENCQQNKLFFIYFAHDKIFSRPKPKLKIF